MVQRPPLSVALVCLILVSSPMVTVKGFQTKRHHNHPVAGRVRAATNHVHRRQQKVLVRSPLLALHAKRPSQGQQDNYYIRGTPSTPLWEDGRLDQLTEWVEQTTTNRPIIREYKPDGLWLWTQWQGTVRSLTLWPILGTMSLSCALYVLQVSDDGAIATALTPLLFWIPIDQSLKILWEYQLTLCTFILTFFTGQAYSHWKTVYLTTRAIQGRINDICLLVTMAAERESEPPSKDVSAANESSSPVETAVTTTYSDRAQALLMDCTRLIRLSHTFFWAAAVPTSSNGLTDNTAFFSVSQSPPDSTNNTTGTESNSAIGPLLLSPPGLEELVETGQLTNNEKQALIDSNLPPSQFAYVLLEWVGSYAINGIRDGTLSTSENARSHSGTNSGLSENLLRQLTALRGEYFNIGDYAAGRMPLAYVQLIQVLVDSLVFLAPVALYSSDLGYVVIPLTGLLTLFFKGLLELSKSFLDPFGVEGFQDQNIRVDVLVSELNFGAGSRWIKAGSSLPIRQKLMDHDDDGSSQEGL